MIYNLAQSFNFTFQMMLCIDNGHEIAVAETTNTTLNCFFFCILHVCYFLKKKNNPVKKTLMQ